MDWYQEVQCSQKEQRAMPDTHIPVQTAPHRPTPLPGTTSSDTITPPPAPTTGSFGDRIENFFKKRQNLWFVGIGAATIIVGFLAYRSNKANQQQTMAATPYGSAAQSPDAATATYDNLFQAISGLQNTEQVNQGFLQQIQQSLTQPPTTTGTGGSNPPTTPLPPASSNPLIPFGQWPAGHPYSSATDLLEHPTIVWQGTTYKEVPGAGGRLWGIAPSGAQVLLYGPQSAYH